MVKITVIGPGGCINNQMQVIEKALKDAGYDVKVSNLHPSNDIAAEDILNHNRKYPSTIELIAEHCPWGG